MLKEIIANYVNKKREIKGFTINDLINKSNSAEGTVKNICYAKADNPGLQTMIPIMEAIDGSFDEMLFPDKFKKQVNNDDIVTLMSAIRETNGEHVHDIRTHYQEHRQDMKENYEKRLADKREIIDSHLNHIESLKKDCLHLKIALCVCICVFIAVLIAEVMNPNLGWFRY